MGSCVGSYRGLQDSFIHKFCEMARPEIYRLMVTQNVNHSILSIPSTMTSFGQSGDYYNIGMFDVSGSMCEVWPHIKENWNREVAPLLNGSTDIYTFGDDVKFRRSETNLEDGDFDCSGTEDLGEALKTIHEKVHQRKEINCRIFWITDGGSCEDSAAIGIDDLHIPQGKTIEFYLLGVGDSFPVQYSIDIRSKLHNGSASCPTLFWNRLLDHEGTLAEMVKIGEEVTKGMLKLNVSIPGKIVPLIPETKTNARCGEFLYYEMEPEQLKSSLVITAEDGSSIPVEEGIRLADARFLVDKLYKQWVSVIMQRHRNKQGVPIGFFEMMENCFILQMKDCDDVASSNIKDRIARKNIKHLKLEFATLMNQSRGIVSLESKFQNEIELAEAIFKSTVQSRYDDRLLKIKGHGESEWTDDILAFKEIYLSLKDEIEALPEPEADDCCRVLMGSFIGDLKDPDFLDVLQLNKMIFLMTMTFTGIPIYAPVKDSAQINPWTLHVKNICVSPFEILSQRVIESALTAGADSTNDKEIRLQQDNPGSVCNAIVPIVPKQHCKALKKLIRTNVFAVGATFCILKNALIVDHSCHLAALACVWFKTIQDYPAASRPEFIVKRLSDIEETAKVYMDRPTIVNYVSALQKNPSLALMTESEEQEGSVLKCESIIKPVFLISLVKDQLKDMEDPGLLLKLIVVEFLGRCLSSYTSKCPYMDLTTSVTEEMRQAKLEQISSELLEGAGLGDAELLTSCFARQDVAKHVRQKVADVSGDVIAKSSLLPDVPQPNVDKIARLRHSGSAGQVSWQGLQAWAQELACGATPLWSPASVQDAFSGPMVVSYVHHALEHRQSRERMTRALTSHVDARDVVSKRLISEQEYFIRHNLLPKVVSRDAAGAPEQLVQQVASRSQAGTRDRPKPPSITT
ncbi:uncharacterized protein LOC125179436, partial [Hyalella azteca]|uniref:Uncharacterized protein LOC125179436 n=1 Tax=Hyalella azteca TaxID=294128 RepID=A0A979FVE9_HYAAZ